MPTSTGRPRSLRLVPLLDGREERVQVGVQDRRLVSTRTYVRTVRAAAKASPGPPRVTGLAVRRLWLPGTRRPFAAPTAAASRTGRPAPWTTSSRDRDRRRARAAGSVRDGRPGGRSGNARQTTPRRAGRRGGAAGDPSAGRAAADEERQPVQRAGAELLDDRDPRRVELRRRRRRAPPGDAVGLLDERDGDAGGERGRRGGDEIRAPSPLPRPRARARARRAARRPDADGLVQGRAGYRARACPATLPIVRGPGGGSRGAEAARAVRRSWSRYSRSPVRLLRPSPQPVRSLTPAATQRLWTELVQRPRVRVVANRGLPAAPRRLLRGDGLAAADDEAGGDGVAVRAVLRLGPAARRPTSRSCGRTRRAGSARSGLRSTRSRRSTSPAGPPGSPRPAAPGTRRASRRGGAWPPPATTSPPATPGR